jgi:hypothetical protein
MPGIHKGGKKFCQWKYISQAEAREKGVRFVTDALQATTFASEEFRRLWDALDRLIVVRWSSTSTSTIDNLMCFSVVFTMTYNANSDYINVVNTRLRQWSMPVIDWYRMVSTLWR